MSIPLSSLTNVGKNLYLCRVCGNTKEVKDDYTIRKGIVQSCGCIRDLTPKKDITGEILKGCLFIGYIGSGLWRVRLGCGCTANKKLNEVTANKFQTKRCRSCVTKSRNMKHGHSFRENKTITYNSWLAMRRRCSDPANNRYHLYGGRGIKYDPSWDDFSVFLKDMGEKPIGYSLEREDVDKDYCKDNCSWIPSSEQSSNRKTNLYLRNTCTQEVLCFKRWCDKLSIDYKYSHLKYRSLGKTLEDIFNLPLEEVTYTEFLGQ